MRGQEINVEDDINNVNHPNVNHPNGRIEALMRALQVECERVTEEHDDAQRERDDATVELHRVTVERDDSIAVINRIRAFLRSNYRVELLCEVVDMSDLNEQQKTGINNSFVQIEWICFHNISLKLLNAWMRLQRELRH